MITLASIPPLITALLSLVLGLFIAARRNRSTLNWTFALWCFLTAYWQGCWVLLFNIGDVKSALFLARLGYSGIIFIPIVFFHFVVIFTQAKRSQTVSCLYYSLGVAFLVSVWGSDLYVVGVYEYKWGFYPHAGPIHLVYLGFLTLMLWRGLILLLEYKRTLVDQRLRTNQVNYILTSTLIYSLAGVDFLGNYGIGYYPVGFIFTNFHAGIITYAIIQYRLLDINVAIKRSLVYALILFGMIIPCFMVIMGGQELAFGRVNYTFSVVTLALLMVVGFLFPKFRFLTEEALERVLFTHRTDYRETLLRSSRDMVSMIDLHNLSESLVQTVGRALGLERVSLFLLDEIKGVFVQTASRGFEIGGADHVALGRNEPLVKKLATDQDVLVKEELEMARAKADLPVVPAQMRDLGAELSVPIISKKNLIGILNLGHKDNREIYSQEDVELLSTLANQAAIAIENAKLYQNLKQSQDTLRRADRLSSLGLLTAGLAHEIRNPLVAIRTFTQLLPERYDDAEFREGFQGLALKEVDRICGLINDLLSFARPSRPKVAAEDMNDVVDGIARILETEAKEKGVEIKRDFGANLPKAWIDREQMKQVFMNLILNAIQAMKDGGLVFIATRVVSKYDPEPSGQFVQVEIRDTGVGIAEENLDHIFDPFFTSKDEGSGLGLSVSHQIIQEHGGHVTVESKIGQGTTFLVNIPLGKPMRSAANGRAQANEANLGH